MPLPSMLAESVLFISIESTMSEGITSSRTWRTDRLGRRNRDAIDGDIGQARLSAAHLDVDALAFDAIERDRGKAADGVGDVGIGQAGDDLRRA